MYRNILVPVDGSATSIQGLNEALRIAKAMSSCIRLIHVVDDFSFAASADAFSGYASDLLPLLRENGEKILAAALSEVKGVGVPAESVLHESFEGRISDLVIKEAQAWPADLIVIGTHGRRGIDRLYMGSDAEQILRASPVPVLLVRGRNVDQR